MRRITKEIFIRDFMKEKIPMQDAVIRRVPLETLIAGTTDKETIVNAVRASLYGLVQFISPKDIGLHPELRGLAQIADIVAERVKSVEPLVADIIFSINQRAQMVDSEEYKDLAGRENLQWRSEAEPILGHGVRVCVDAGVPREAVAGGDGVHMGRTLAGDDSFSYSKTRGVFFLDQSTFLKRLIHNHRDGVRTILEIFIEHTNCGRRGQMIANHHESNDIAHLYKIVFANLLALFPEFIDSPQAVNQGLTQIMDSWTQGKMTKDGGVWAGILVKIAQRQAYKQIADGFTPVIPIEIFDKMNGNLIVGIDTIESLTHAQVLSEGGYTEKALEDLSQEGVIFSLKHEVASIKDLLSNGLKVAQGLHSFDELQNNWLVVKKSFFNVTEDLWNMYNSQDKKYDGLKKMVDKFLQQSLGPVAETLEEVDRKSGVDNITSSLMMRRHVHHLFRVLAYAWVLDTFTRGNPPGHHIEDHLATGDSAVLGVTDHLSLGQGDLQPPTVFEIATGYSVLMHSTPGQDGLPVVAMMKHDTSQPDAKSLTTEETERASADFRELLKLWPYIVVGDIVPIIAVRGKARGGVNRLALSVILSFGDIIKLAEHRDDLAKFVPASNSQGKVVNIPASMVLTAGINAGKDLRVFRAEVKKIADNFSAPEVQKKLK